jgi:hypothetical protein
VAMLYSNENFPLPVVLGLRARGHDVLTIQDTGRAGQAMPDDEVVTHTTVQGRKRSDPPRHPGMDCRDPDAMEGESRGGLNAYPREGRSHSEPQGLHPTAPGIRESRWDHCVHTRSRFFRSG